MKILALILSLYQGGLEIRSDGVFETPQECVEHILRRVHNQDFRRDDVRVVCIQQEDVEATIRMWFGRKA